MIADALRLRIIGQGPVALALLLFARRAGIPAASIDIDPPLNPGLTVSPSLARRTLALSLGSWQLLGRIIELPRACPIYKVEVSLQGRAGRSRFTSTDMGTAALGYVTDYQSVQQALINAVTSGATSAVAALSNSPQTYQSDIRSQVPTIIIHAEGNAGDEADVREFSQHAVLANLFCPQQPAHCALERFTPDGPLALLPMAESGHFSLVWCCSADAALRRTNIAEAEFLDELRVKSGSRLVGARLASPRSQSPLQRRQRKQTQAGLEVWIGNAAQALHPVAGQGLNLGLRDSFELAQWLARLALQRPLADATQIEQSLKNFVDLRRPDRRQTILLTDTLASVFTKTWMSPAQSLALSVLDLTPGLRQRFAGRLMFGQR